MNCLLFLTLRSATPCRPATGILAAMVRLGAIGFAHRGGKRDLGQGKSTLKLSVRLSSIGDAIQISVSDAIQKWRNPEHIILQSGQYRRPSPIRT